MALKCQNARFALHFNIILFALSFLLLNPASGPITKNYAILSAFADFSRSAQNGQTDVLRNVYVDKILDLPIVQQPLGNAAYVSNNDGEATQFRIASKFGNVGLLAHNQLSGKSFPALLAGQEVRLVYKDGRVEYFVVKEILKYQALQPNSPYSSFKNLNKDETLTAQQMFQRVYLGDHHLTFQTCIEAEGNLSWGRLFIIAQPENKLFTFDHMWQ